MLPLRLPRVDSSGALRMAYWPANDRLLGHPLGAVRSSGGREVCSGSGGEAITAVWLADANNSEHVNVCEGEMGRVGVRVRWGGVGVRVRWGRVSV